MDLIEGRIQELLVQMTLQEKVSLLSGQDVWNTVPIERLGIPSITMSDGPHGVRANNPEAKRPAGLATAFPTGVSMASSWNPELVERVGQALGEETNALGCDILLGPCVNIVRHPLAGRNFETYSEDPYLAGRIGVAWVKGLQSRGVGASLKHYATNNQEIERMRGSSQVDERTLREIYLPQFEMVVNEARPWTVMCSYNRINGVYASQNRYLLNDILRDEWGFEGAVVSDWTANHTIFESVQAGLDLEMPGPALYYGNLLLMAVQNWQIDEVVVDEAVRRVLRLIAWAGKLPGLAGGSLPARKAELNSVAHQDLARQLAEEAITLLKNEGNVLPLKPGEIKSIAIIGPNAAELQISGGGSSAVEPPYRVSPLSALQARLQDKVTLSFEQGCDNYVELPSVKPEYLRQPAGEGPGLKVEYFSNPNYSGPPVVVKVDPGLDASWFFNPPVEGIQLKSFSVRWTGTLTVPESGNYIFKVSNSAQARIYLDGSLLLEHKRIGDITFENLSAATETREVMLQGGRAYDLKVEFSKQSDDFFAHIGLLLARVYAPGEDQRIARAARLAKQADVALVFAGMPRFYESEGGDRPDLEMPGPQIELVRAVAAANPNTVVILNAGSPVSMPWAQEVPAILLAYYPGLEGGNAIANVLTGEVNPSGKLTVTWPKRLEDTPAFTNYPGSREVHYGEGIFVGYRWYDEREIEPLFPFGHGLSYTGFELRDLQVPAQVKAGQGMKLQVSVQNTGNRAGKEVVQVYVSDRRASLPRPPKELKGFAKVALQPGESRSLAFELDQRALSFYDPHQKAWVAEPGEFEVLVGFSSTDIRARASFRLEG